MLADVVFPAISRYNFDNSVTRVSPSLLSAVWLAEMVSNYFISSWYYTFWCHILSPVGIISKIGLCNIYHNFCVVERPGKMHPVSEKLEDTPLWLCRLGWDRSCIDTSFEWRVVKWLLNSFWFCISNEHPSKMHGYIDETFTCFDSMWVRTSSAVACGDLLYIYGFSPVWTRMSDYSLTRQWARMSAFVLVFMCMDFHQYELACVIVISILCFVLVKVVQSLDIVCLFVCFILRDVSLPIFIGYQIFSFDFRLCICIVNCQNNP